jgi:hypothetical protein
MCSRCLGNQPVDGGGDFFYSSPQLFPSCLTELSIFPMNRFAEQFPSCGLFWQALPATQREERVRESQTNCDNCEGDQNTTTEKKRCIFFIHFLPLRFVVVLLKMKTKDRKGKSAKMNYKRLNTCTG